MPEAKPLPKKRCTNAACATCKIEIRTDKEDCIVCSKPLQPTDPFRDLFGGFPGNLFGL